MADIYVTVEGTQIRISALAGWKKTEFVDTYTGVLMDVEAAWKKVEKYTKKKPVVEEDSE